MSNEVKLGTEKIEQAANAIAKLVVAGKKISADKKVNLEDLPVAMGLIVEIPSLVSAFKDFGAILDEGKDLDIAEVVGLIQKVHAIVKEIEKA